MKTILFMTLLLTACTINAQVLNGKFVYSHHNRASTSFADSIFSLDSNGVKKFITLGFDPKVSPSGHYMAFENGPSYSAYRANVWMRNLTTKKDTQIISNNDYLNYFDFYSSEQQIVYAEQCNIYTSNINGSNAYTFLVCNPCDCYSDDPQMRYSDNKIVYHNLHYGIYTCSSNGSNSQKFANTVPGDLYPTWSVDGKKIVFVKTAGGNNIYKLNVATGDTTRLTHLGVKDTITLNPYFSDDGTKVFFIARINGKIGLYKGNTNGSGSYTLVHAFSNKGSIYDYFLGKANTTTTKAPLVGQNAAVIVNAMSSQNLREAFHVYPNPSNGSFKIIMDKVLPKSEIFITDNTGKIIFQQNVNNTSSLSINTKAAKGIYFITLKTETFSEQQKLIIQ